MKIIANIQLKNSSKGGRKNPIYSGYRPSFRLYESMETQSDCVINVLNKYNIIPGESGDVEITILHPHKFNGITIERFIITEGVKEIASGYKKH